MKNKNKKIKTHNIIFLICIISIFITSYLIFTSIINNHNNKINKLKSENLTLKSKINSELTVKDSLFKILKSNDYLYYVIEKESSIKIPKHVEPEFIRYMYEQAINNNIPINIMFRLVYKESSFRYNAISHMGAYGFMQLMPNTYKWYCKRLGIEEIPHTEEKNIYIGTYMLYELYSYWYNEIKEINNKTENIEKDAWKHTLASYNAGMGNVNYYGNIFNNEDVYNYVAYITKEY